jgi:LacI family transcriptional regulator
MMRDLPFPPRPTLRTLAEATGFAVATVSRALADAPDISAETKRQVRAAADRLGYRPNRAGQRLRTGKTHVIALCLSPESGVMVNASRLLYAAAEALRATPYHLMVLPVFPDQDPMEPIRYLVETESADGVILNQTKPDDPRVRFLAERGFPFATHGRTFMGLEHDWCDFDNEAFARVAVRALADAGRRRLLLIAPNPDHAYSRHMIHGFTDEAARLGLAAQVLEDASTDLPETELTAHVAARLTAADAPRPDGFVSGSTTATIATILGAEAAGLVQGRSFDIVGKETIPLLRMFRPGTLVVPEDVGRVGQLLAQAILRRIEDRTAPFLQDLERPTQVCHAGALG